MEDKSETELENESLNQPENETPEIGGRPTTREFVPSRSHVGLEEEGEGALEDVEDEEELFGEIEEKVKDLKSHPAIRLRYPSEYAEAEGEGGVLGRGYDDSGEGKYVFLYGEGMEAAGEGTVYPTSYPSSPTPSIASLVPSEETEEEKAARLLRELKIDTLKQKLSERQSLRRRNVFLQKKLVEHFKKRRMDHVLQEDTKGLDQDSKYLRRLFAFQEFKVVQESEMINIKSQMEDYKQETDDLQIKLKATLNKLVEREREVATPLVITKTGRKVNEKIIDRIITRQVAKVEEMGKKRLKFIKIKNLIEEKKQELRGIENIGEGLHMMDYEQMKIDSTNYNDKIEEKTEELSKLRIKTKTCIQTLGQVREKAFALDGDIELLEKKVYNVNETYNNTRTKLTLSKKKRDKLREEFLQLKKQSGLLTRDILLKDFEESIDEADVVASELQHLHSQVNERKTKFVANIKPGKQSSYIDFMFPCEVQALKKQNQD